MRFIKIDFMQIIYLFLLVLFITEENTHEENRNYIFFF
jgi:hypothetical protein